MKLWISIAALALMGFSAQARVKSYEMTCAEAKAYVQEQGAVILQTGTHTYDRYVAHGGYCSGGQIAEHAWVPTSDKRSCMVGYVCRQHDNR